MRWSFGIALAVCLVAPAFAGRLVIGEQVHELHAPPRPYAAEAGATPQLVWSHTFQHPGASYVAPHFSWFELAPGDYAIVRSPDGKQSWRYEGLGRASLGRSPEGFWSSHVRGDTAIVELHGRAADGSFGFALDGFARGLSDKEIELVNEIELPDTAAICGADDSSWAKCYMTSEPEIYERSRAVVRLLIDGTFACTGWLVGCEGHLLTNEHCIGNSSDALNTDFEFMAEGATCTTNCSSWGACPGTIEASSAQLVALDVALDYTLVKLPASLAEEYGYFRLRPEGPTVGERIWIPQHPLHWGKRIAVASSHAQDQSGFCEVFSLTSPGCSGSIPDVGYHCDTQGGSSGSPVIAYADQRVVALHHCASCPNRGANIANVIADLGPSSLPDCAVADLAGELAIDQEIVSCSDTLHVTLQDDSLIGQGTQEIEVWSGTETVPEIVALDEGSPGTFAGNVTTAPAGTNAPGDGAVALSHADTLTLRYVDRDAGTAPAFVEATATADCQAPIIDKVDASDVTGNAATITWDTSEPADTTVLSAAPSHDDALVIAHSVRLTGLSECSEHSYGVSSTDAVGNVAVDDDGGAMYVFETGKNVQPEHDSADTPRAIPDNSAAGAASTIVVSDGRVVTDVDVELIVSHPFTGDLKLALHTPGGEEILLADQLGGAGNDYDGTIFDDEAQAPIALGAPPFIGRFKPIEALSAADGLSGAGAWTLEVEDTDSGEVGTLESWRLVLSYPHQMCGAHVRYRSHSLIEDRCAAGAGDGNGVWEAGERVHFSLEIDNDGSEPLSELHGTVVAITPGVVPVVDAAAFPDVAVGASAASSTPVAFDLPLGLACGDPLEFRLDLASAQGSLDGVSFEVFAGQAASIHAVSLKETFSFGLPASWSVIDGGDDDRSWYADDTADPAGCANIDPEPPIVGRWAAVDSDCAGSASMDEALVTPLLNLVNAHRVTLVFDHYFNRYQNEIADVDVRSSRTGGSWVNVARFLEDTPNPQHVVLDISAQASGASNAQVRFHYHGAEFDWFWFVDNVEVGRDFVFSCSMNVCSAGVDAPAAVPDGSGEAEPVRASRTEQGNGIVVEWDDACESPATNIVYGDLAEVASFDVAGAICGIDQPATWDPAPPGDLWFLLVTTDGEGVESSWGQSSDGSERHGLAASGTCGTTVKDVSGSCP